MISSNSRHSYLPAEAAGCPWRELDEFLSTEEEADAAGESATEATTAHEGRDGKPSLHQAKTQPSCQGGDGVPRHQYHRQNHSNQGQGMSHMVYESSGG